jgi:hypothetical protein
MTTKTFDCVEMKRRCQEQMRQKMQAASRDDELAWFRRVGENLSADIQRAKRGNEEGSNK